MSSVFGPLVPEGVEGKVWGFLPPGLFLLLELSRGPGRGCAQVPSGATGPPAAATRAGTLLSIDGPPAAETGLQT